MFLISLVIRRSKLNVAYCIFSFFLIPLQYSDLLFAIFVAFDGVNSTGLVAINRFQNKKIILLKQEHVAVLQYIILASGNGTVW